MRAAALLALCLAAPASGQSVITSSAPERVGVTVYRDLNRGNARPDRAWLNGYALISETRTVSIPAGESELRFEGVASGIIPQSAIIGGIPEGLLERNRDALLLSAGSLVDRALGKRVSLRRTDKATGKVSSEEAVVRSGGDGGVVLQTAAGVEALRCTGLNETLVYDRVPAGLSARPTLSVKVRARQPLTATVTLSYLATGFDWQADYVGVLSPDGRTLQLQAWLTLASTDDTSFVGATTQAVAGRVNREQADVPAAEAPELRLQCWPQGRTSDVPSAAPLAYPPLPPPPAPMMESAGAIISVGTEDIVVTGARMTAQRERLGDLQLYRIPEPVTVAANAQKQVGLIDQPAVKVTPVYRLAFDARDNDQETEAELVLRTRNRRADGLGLPLPAGQVVMFRTGAGRPLLIGEGALDDTAVEEKVEVRVARSTAVRGTLVSGEGDDWTVTLTNDRDVPVAVEVALEHDDDDRLTGNRRLVRRNGETYWDAVVPPNSRATLTYEIKN